MINPQMECFSKASSSTDEEDKKQQWHICVRSGSKLRNIISLALRLLQVHVILNSYDHSTHTVYTSPQTHIPKQKINKK